MKDILQKVLTDKAARNEQAVAKFASKGDTFVSWD